MLTVLHGDISSWYQTRFTSTSRTHSTGCTEIWQQLQHHQYITWAHQLPCIVNEDTRIQNGVQLDEPQSLLITTTNIHCNSWIFIRRTATDPQHLRVNWNKQRKSKISFRTAVPQALGIAFHHRHLLSCQLPSRLSHNKNYKTMNGLVSVCPSVIF